MSKRYQYEIIREVVSTETVHAIVVAKTAVEAREIAEGLGDGIPPDWPEVDRYNIADRSAKQYNLLSVTEVKQEKDTA